MKGVFFSPARCKFKFHYFPSKRSSPFVGYFTRTHRHTRCNIKRNTKRHMPPKKKKKKSGPASGGGGRRTTSAAAAAAAGKKKKKKTETTPEPLAGDDDGDDDAVGDEDDDSNGNKHVGKRIEVEYGTGGNKRWYVGTIISSKPKKNVALVFYEFDKQLGIIDFPKMKKDTRLVPKATKWTEKMMKVLLTKELKIKNEQDKEKEWMKQEGKRVESEDDEDEDEDYDD